MGQKKAPKKDHRFSQVFLFPCFSQTRCCVFFWSPRVFLDLFYPRVQSFAGWPGMMTKPLDSSWRRSPVPNIWVEIKKRSSRTSPQWWWFLASSKTSKVLVGCKFGCAYLFHFRLVDSLDVFENIHLCSLAESCRVVVSQSLASDIDVWWR